MIHPEVRLGAYPTRIPDAALDRLRVLVERHAVPRAPRFAAWMSTSSTKSGSGVFVLGAAPRESRG